jgi:DNA-binding beta-propeller fold protein YncE
MARTFNCPSCSAPLDFAGEVTQKCDHCGGTVIAPHEMFYAGSASPFDDLSSLKGRALKIAEVQRLIHAGKKIEAIEVFREAFGTGLKEAKEAVEAIERGESVDISGFRVQTSTPQPIKINIDTKEIGRAATSVGKVVLAISVAAVLGVLAIGAAVLWFAFPRSQSTTVISSPSAPETKPEAKAVEASPLIENLKIGGEGDAPGRFKDNRHVAVDGSGRIYSSDYSPIRIQVFNPDGSFLNQWLPADGNNLYGLAADREGNLFVANNRGVFKYEGENGKLLGKIDGVYPRGMALSWDGKIVVTEGRSFSVYDKSMKLINKFADAAKNVNSSFGFQEVAVGGDGTIFMLGRTDKDVFKFTIDGKFLDRFPHGGNSPNGIAIDPTGRIFISDTSSIKILDAAGNKLADIKAFQAFGIAFASNGELYLANRPFVTKYTLVSAADHSP